MATQSFFNNRCFAVLLQLDDVLKVIPRLFCHWNATKATQLIYIHSHVRWVTADAGYPAFKLPKAELLLEKGYMLFPLYYYTRQHTDTLVYTQTQISIIYIPSHSLHACVCRSARMVVTWTISLAFAVSSLYEFPLFVIIFLCSMGTALKRISADANLIL